MARLTITQIKRGRFSPALPHYLLINGKMLGLMKEPSITLNVPEATFEVRIQSLFKWFYSAATVTTREAADTFIEFSDREKWWDALFVVDIILWCVKGLLHLSSPWTWIYEAFTNGYFVAWLVYEWVIRERYFHLDIFAKPVQHRIVIRDAREKDAPFLARCILAGMHFDDFASEMSEEAASIYSRLVECERRGDLLYSYKKTRVAEVDGVPVGSLLSYPGDGYRELRHLTFTELWPDLAEMDATSEQETDPGEYYLDTLAVLPEFRHRGIGRTLLEDSIRKGTDLGYRQITLVADAQMPHLIALYTSIGFIPADRRKVFGVDFQRMIFTVS